MKRKITRLARAGNRGGFGVSGRAAAVSAAACNDSSPSSAASARPPNPRAERRNISRRESLGILDRGKAFSRDECGARQEKRVFAAASVTLCVSLTLAFFPPNGHSADLPLVVSQDCILQGARRV